MSIKNLGKYELLASLGSGATAEVYQARDTVLGREVALKILKPALVADPGAFERFIREAQAAAGLFHPNIATVLDMGEADGRYFIAMRYIPGQSLDKVLKEKGPLSWEQARLMLQQVGSALEFAHKKGLLHRDVKPSNIICSPEGEYVLTDFGLQKAMAASNLTSHTGAVLGTPAYIAPEIWNGEPASPASDVYSLACVLFETITGKILFGGETTQEIITKHLIKGPQFPEKWPQEIPSGIETILGKALAREPQGRFARVAEFIAALDNRFASAGKASQPEEQPLPGKELSFLPNYQDHPLPSKIDSKRKENLVYEKQRSHTGVIKKKRHLYFITLSIALSFLAIILSRLAWVYFEEWIAISSCTVAVFSIIFGLISIGQRKNLGVVGIAISIIAIVDALSAHWI
jgi:serine/threonine protein kinase